MSFETCQFIDVIHNPVLIVQENLTIVDANKEALLYFGMTSAAILGIYVTQFFSEQIIQLAINEIEKTKKPAKIIAFHDTSSDWYIARASSFCQTGYLLFSERNMDYFSKAAHETLRVIEEFSEWMPGNFYWKNTEGIYLGCNTALIKMLGLPSKQCIVGKTDKELWPEQAAELRRNDLYVMETGRPLEREEVALLADGKKSYFLATKVPMKDNFSKIIGIIGTSIDITDKKVAERLTLENYMIRAGEDEKFRKIVAQAAHDGRSPISALLMLSKSSRAKDIPEEIRTIINNTATHVNDIFNNLLTSYEIKTPTKVGATQKKNFMVSLTLQQILAEKKFEYQNKPVIFESDFEANAVFSFVNLNMSDFKRMVSNLINNSVDAFEGKTGKINVRLKNKENHVVITITDNGKGMSAFVQEKILNNVAVTSGKASGHGIGFTQISNTLQLNEGQLFIHSEVGLGTEITVTFPCVPTPTWLSNKIIFAPDDIIVILDDDTSIHKAWDTRLMIDASGLTVKHFEKAQEAIEWINALSFEDKERIFLLSDYELLSQEYNGLDVIQKTQVHRSILVTSHSDNDNLQFEAALTKTKIVPKLLASEITIQVREPEIIHDTHPLSDAEVVIVEDDDMIRENLPLFAFPKRKVEVYANSRDILNNAHRYAKNTLFCIDENLGEDSTSGIFVAKQLYKQGFGHLYLFSGRDFTDQQLPHYLCPINKMDLERVAALNQLIDKI